MTWTPVDTEIAPEWFLKAVAAPHTEHRVQVAGTAVHYLDWGDAGKPGLVLVHGGAAHAHWWSFLAPFFATRWHVVALDLSGHGDSGRRPWYSHETWADEVMTVADAAGFPGPPVVVGHSLGGMVAIMTAARYGDRLAGAVLVDSPVRRPDPESEEGRGGRAFRSPGVYAEEATALAHFRVVPEQPCANPWIIDHIARNSLHRTDEGWTWKFDPVVFSHSLIPLRDQLRSLRCRLALLRGELSAVVPPDTAEYMYELMGRNAPVVSIPEAHHHLILDQPLAFVAALRTLLADWQHSTQRNAVTPRGTSPAVVVTGLVEPDLRVTAHELGALPSVVDDVARYAPGAIGRAVRVADILGSTRVGDDATHCTVIADGGAYRASIPLDDLRDGGWLAFALGESALPTERGGPFRLTVAAGTTLCWNVKQVAELRVTAGEEPDDVPEDPPH